MNDTGNEQEGVDTEIFYVDTKDQEMSEYIVSYFGMKVNIGEGNNLFKMFGLSKRVWRSDELEELRMEIKRAIDGG